MAPLQAGDRVKIVKGWYKNYRYGTYLRPRGTKQAFIAIDGDTKPERYVLLTSITSMNVPTSRKRNRMERPANERPTVTIDAEEYNELCRDVAALTVAVQRLNARLQNYSVNN